MGLSQALTTAISGLSSHQTALDTIGNNIANVNTTGYKKGIYSFSTLLEQVMKGGTASDATTGRGAINPMTMGLGTQISSISKDFTQGSLDVTDVATDMAISGNGYFVLKNGNSYVYTRDGSFYLGSSGELLGSAGLQVQGIMADEKGVIDENDAISDIIIPIGETGGAEATTEMSLTGNLDYDQEVSAGVQLVSSAPVDATAASVLSGYSNDSTWTALNGVAAGSETAINGGTVQTTSALAVFVDTDLDGVADSYQAAGLATDLRDLYYLSNDTWVQPFSGIADGDQVTITFEKGGRSQTASFTYTTNSNTLQDFLEFLAGDVDSTANVSTVANIEGTANTDTEGGAMGLIDVAGNVSTATTGGTSPYDAPVETAGAFSRSYTSAVDYNNTGVLGSSFNISILSNLGSENAISDIEISYGNVNYTDIFNADVSYGTEQGGSCTTTAVLYDSLGNAREVTLTLTLVDRDTNFSTWRWVADSLDDTDADWQLDNSGNLSTSTNVGTGLIRFDSEGNYIAGTELSETGGIEITLDNSGVSSPLKITLREGLSSDLTQSLDFSALTQFASDSTFNLESQNGTAPGTLDEFSVTEDGVIQGIYSNGVVKDIARIVLALVPNSNGMIAVGDNLYYTTASSGSAQVGFANTGGRGTVNSGELEASNVDLSDEFTDLIQIQRGYQANARVITTADDMLEELVNLKR